MAEYFEPQAGIAEDAARPAFLRDFTSAVERARGSVGALDLAPAALQFCRELLRLASDACAAYDLDGFEGRASSGFPDRVRFRQAVELARALVDPGPDLPELLDMLAYLDAAVIPEQPAAPPLHELRIDRELTRQRSALLATPASIGELRAQFELFQDRFQAAYRAGHAAYARQAAAERRRIPEIEAAARALALLNGVERLGPASGVEAIDAWGRLSAGLRACELDEAALDDSVGREGTCAACGYTLGEAVPVAALLAAREGIRAALEEQRRRLGRAAVARAAGNGDRAAVDRFLRAVQAADLGPLIGILDERSVRLIEELLSDD